MHDRHSADFWQGYEYARLNYDRLFAGYDVREMLALAGALGEEQGAGAEVAQGMAAFCRELAGRLKGSAGKRGGARRGLADAMSSDQGER